MKSVSLKIPDEVIDETDAIVNNLNVSRNSYINLAISHYNKIQRRDQIAKQLQFESKLVATDSMAVLREMEQLDGEA